MNNMNLWSKACHNTRSSKLKCEVRKWNIVQLVCKKYYELFSLVIKKNILAKQYQMYLSGVCLSSIEKTFWLLLCNPAGEGWSWGQTHPKMFSKFSKKKSLTDWKKMLDLYRICFPATALKQDVQYWNLLNEVYVIKLL